MYQSKAVLSKVKLSCKGETDGYTQHCDATTYCEYASACKFGRIELNFMTVKF